MSECHGCTRCGRIDPRALYARVADSRWLCRRCWRTEGEPQARFSDGFRHQQETKTREQMMARGGADRYRVLAGKA